MACLIHCTTVPRSRESAETRATSRPSNRTTLVLSWAPTLPQPTIQLIPMLHQQPAFDRRGTFETGPRQPQRAQPIRLLRASARAGMGRGRTIEHFLPAPDAAHQAAAKRARLYFHGAVFAISCSGPAVHRRRGATRVRTRDRCASRLSDESIQLNTMPRVA
jgi:hypothetical protein